MPVQGLTDDRSTVTGSAGKITFRALNPAIATVDANGVVTAVSDGLAYFEIACGTVKTVAAVSVRNTPHAQLHQGAAASGVPRR